jgi:hypothetical protein
MYKVYFIKFESNLKLKIMKKLILALLLTSLASYSQNVNLDLLIKNIVPIDFSNHKTEATALTVPSGQIWIIQGNEDAVVFLAKPNSFSSGKSFYVGRSTAKIDTMFLTAGTKVWCFLNTTVVSFLFNIIVFNAPSTQTGTLALNDIKDIDKKIELFPNPTNSKIALNSEKNYDIEIYDMQGNIVMKDKGNSIDLSNLSKAVYILKAYDNLEKTSTTYKVVKN